MKRIGVDVGGTFTDLILVDEDNGRISVDKLPSTPGDPSAAVIAGVEQLCEKAGVRIEEVDNLLHGTTVATNIALTDTGAEVGLITTEGFRDILHIARHKKPYNFSLQQELPWQSRPLVKRRHRLTVAERVTVPDGDVLVPLDEDQVRERARALREAGTEAVAICLLHSYLNPAHEARIKQIVLEEHPDCYVSVSHEVLPLYREYERFSTVALNAYVGPKVSKYLMRFDAAMRDAGLRRSVQLMQSSGGMTGIEAAAQRPVNLLMSGPVAGLIGGIWAARMSGYEDVVTLDIGGTSADIGVAAGGALRMRHLLDTKVGDYQVMVPMVDIDTIGAGGGSIAYVDDGGVFRVGPQSAGAVPGPACYGRGGTEPTSTDAQVLLGRLRVDRGLLGGGMDLDPELAKQALAGLAGRLGTSLDEVALGALQIQKFEMTQAIELNSVRRGYDPRDFTLVAAGGAGPLFACEIAQELEIPRVLVPPHPGIIAATGLLATDLQHEYVATERQALATLDGVRLQARYDELTAQALAALEGDGVPDDRRLFRRLADCRYAGQGYEVRVEAPAGDVGDAWADALAGAFHAAHEREYGHRFDATVEIVNIRVVGVGRIEELRWTELEPAGGEAEPVARREVVFDVGGRAERHHTPFYDREDLRAGHAIPGPAIVEQYDTTTILPPGTSAEVDRHGNLVVDCRRPAVTSAARSGDLAAPILMRVIGGAFSAIAKEMAGVLFRMSYSSIIRESEDLGAGIFDREGNVLAESDSTPMFMGAMPKIVRGVMSLLGDDIHDGDVILHNDPYLGATHSPDAAIVVPIFHAGELVGFAGASAHLLDIGGAYPGLAVDLVDNTSEGTIWRALKVSERGVRQDSLWAHILGNTRTPTQNRGDLEAMIAACELAKRRTLQLLDKYGREAVLGAGADWIDYSERMLRQEIAKIPDGEYETEIGWLDDDGRNRGVPLPVKVKVIVSGDEITYDLTGSSDEVPTGYNVPYEGSTVSAFTFITRMIFLDEVAYPVFVPQNEGMLRPVKVIAPHGSIFNPRKPRACFARFCQVQRAVDLALRALAPVVPERITAGNSAHLHFISYSGFDADEGEYWVYLEVDEGSYGGRPAADGLDTVDCLIANTRNNPIEELEWRFPMRTERYELRDEPCAAGEWRGGRRRRARQPLPRRHDRHLRGRAPRERPAVGDLRRPRRPQRLARAEPRRRRRGVVAVQGHRAGAPGRRCARDHHAQLGRLRRPLAARSASSCSRDVLDGITTAERAQADYGVVLDLDAGAVDAEATARRREAARSGVAPAVAGEAGR